MSLDALTSRLHDLVDRVRSDRVALAATAAGALLAGVVIVRWATSPGNGRKYMNDDQLAFAEPFSVVVRGKTIGVRPVSVCDTAAAAKTLASANKDDPVIVNCSAESADAAARERSLQWLFRLLLKSTVPSSYGSIALRTAGNEATAIWFPKGADVQFTALAYHGGWQYVFRYSGWDRRGRFPGYSEAIRVRRQRLMAGHEGAYFYLLTSGVAEGVADADVHRLAVIQPVLERADALGMPCYVEATSEKARDFFATIGFRELEQFRLFNFTVYPMKREAVVSK